MHRAVDSGFLYVLKEIRRMRTPRRIGAYFGFASIDECAIVVSGRLYADVFDTPPPVCAKHVEAQRVLISVYLLDQAVPQCCPLGGVQLALEHGKLHALAVVEASSGDSAQASCSTWTGCSHIVGNQHQHDLLPDICGVAVQVATQVPHQKLGLNMRQQPNFDGFLQE